MAIRSRRQPIQETALFGAPPARPVVDPEPAYTPPAEPAQTEEADALAAWVRILSEKSDQEICRRLAYGMDRECVYMRAVSAVFATRQAAAEADGAEYPSDWA